MNDLESKLRALSFREPPPGWRGSMVSLAIDEPGWRKWLAPHPAAWAAVAAVWIILAVVSQTFDKSTAAPRSNLAATRNADPLEQPTLFAFQLRSVTGLEPPL